MLTSLPIDAFAGRIKSWLDLDDDDPRTCFLVLSAETGAGKSTRVPQMAYEMGLTTIVTQPRRLTVREVARRVCDELNVKLGTSIGYRTGELGDQCDSSDTKLLFVTDGIALVREAICKKNADVLVIDEVHEWNINIEALLAWARHEAFDNGRRLRVILMSATLDTASLSAFLGGCDVVNVPGRCYPVEVLKVTATTSYIRDMAIDAISDAKAGKNVLAFLPGKGELDEFSLLVSKEIHTDLVFQLHGQMTREAMEPALRIAKLRQGVVIAATNVAETGVTIDGVNSVLDSGLERQMKFTNGIERLTLSAISQANRDQRKGRAGRTMAGTYRLYCEEKVSQYPVPEILRGDLSATALRLANMGYGINTMTFYHMPERTACDYAINSLKMMQLIADDGINCTQMGRSALRLAVEPRMARMIIEGIRLNATDDIIDTCCVLQYKILGRGEKDECGYEQTPKWHQFKHVDGDIPTMIQAFRAGMNHRGDVRDIGLNGKALRDAMKMRQDLQQRVRSVR